MKEINTWVVVLVRYSKPVLIWIKAELRQIDQRTRTFLTKPKALHTRDDIHRKEKEDDKPAL